MELNLPERLAFSEEETEAYKTLLDLQKSDEKMLEDLETAFEKFKVPESVRTKFRAEALLAKALRKELYAMAERIKNGEVLSSTDVAKMVSEVTAQQGFDMGLPLPDAELGHQFITAQNTPLGFALQVNTEPEPSELAVQLKKNGFKVRNSWFKSEELDVAVVHNREGKAAVITEFANGRRMRKMMNTAITRSMNPNMTAEAEERAIASLKKKVTEAQYASYILNGMLIESSQRSDLKYIFRKGYPTLVLSYHGEERGRIIACLCLHPFGYYAGTYCGAMTPTDEVIAHLLMMRADEHKFWAKSGQWPAYDPRSGI